MSNREKLFWFLGIPFLVSGAFWLSPWLGWPSLVCGAILWLGVLVAASK